MAFVLRTCLFFGILSVLPSTPLAACQPAEWGEVCDHAKKECFIISSLCPPQNSLMEALRPDSMSRIGDGGYTVNAWQYPGCDGGRNETFASCYQKARSELGNVIFQLNYEEPATTDEWPLFEISTNNIVIQGHPQRPLYVKATKKTAIANAERGGLGMLCRIFWFTGSNVTLRHTMIDTMGCCDEFDGETSLADCTPIVCSAAVCDNMHIDVYHMYGVGVGVRVQRDDGGLTSARNVSVQITRTITAFNGVTPVSLFWYDAHGDATVRAPQTRVIYKVGTYDTVITVGSDMHAVNISDMLSPMRALYVEPDPDSEYHHKPPQNIAETITYLSAILLGGTAVTIIMAVIVTAFKKELIEKEKGE